MGKSRAVIGTSEDFRPLTITDVAPAQNVLSLIQSLRSTPPRLILSPPSQPRRASVALILRMRPAPELVFEGNEPAGYTGPVVPADEFGIELPFDEFLRLGEFKQLPFLNFATSMEPVGQLVLGGNVTLR